MGFKEVVLIGFDGAMELVDGYFNYRHFYDNYVKAEEDIVRSCFKVNTLSDGEKVFESTANFHRQLKIVEKYARNSGIKICNATPNSLINMFESVEFEEIL